MAVLGTLLTQQPGPPAAPAVKTELVFKGVIVGAATTMPESVEWYPRPVHILTGDDLLKLGITTAVDALRLLPGVDVRARGPMQVQADFSIRGATFGQHLVMVDGIRLNDSQTGHHNGEIPIPVEAIDHVEVVGGASSSAHGADALGGTINIVTRTGTHALGTLTLGEHALGGFSGSAQLSPRAPTVSGWYQQSDGFMFDRDFKTGGGLVRGTMNHLTYDIRHSRRAFGANGLYGNSPTRQWTDQTVASVTTRGLFGARNSDRGWDWDLGATFKNHGDHFRWDLNRPGFAENQHRTNTADVRAAATLTHANTYYRFGVEGGADFIRSNNLGNRDYQRGGAYVEIKPVAPTRLTYQLSVRADQHSSFGRNVSPSAAVAWSVGDGWRVRVSGARAFRVPTFTDLYYHDPANQGSPDLKAEHGWTLDAGVDYAKHGWSLAITPFGRWDDDVIDWVRASPVDLWRSTNLRDVTTRGLEVSATRRLAGGLARVGYTRLDVDAPALDLLSKYVLEYAKDSLTGSMAAPIARTGLTVSANADMRHRLDGQQYTLLGARVAQTLRRATVFIEGSNLLNREYHEVLGVAMPGRWVSFGVVVR
jgi:iron complex outermembrane receptor protein